jgi:hypothetical protein
MIAHYSNFIHLLNYLFHGAGFFLEKLTGFSASQEIPRVLWNKKFPHRYHKRPPHIPILRHPNPVFTPTYHNSIHSCLKLTTTTETIQNFRFLDSIITRIYPRLEIIKFRKPTASDTTPNILSNKVSCITFGCIPLPHRKNVPTTTY